MKYEFPLPKDDAFLTAIKFGKAAISMKEVLHKIAHDTDLTVIEIRILAAETLLKADKEMKINI